MLLRRYHEKQVENEINTKDLKVAELKELLDGKVSNMILEPEKDDLIELLEGAE